MAQLLDLPTELLICIACYLCPHCSKKNAAGRVRCGTALRRCWGDSMALSRLSRTCRTLRDIAQPILYHWAVPHPGEILSLARTIIHRPDLACGVRELCIDSQLREERKENAWLATPKELGIFDKYMATLREDPALKIKHEEMFEMLDTLYSPVDRRFWGFRLRKLRRALSIYIINKVPNVERLAIESNELPYPDDGFNPLPRLTDLRLKFTEEDSSSGGNIAEFRSVLSVAPALDILRGQHLIDISHMPSHLGDTVRKLHLSMCALGQESHRAVMRQFKNLTSFSYRSSCAFSWPLFEATPAVLNEALLIRRHTLKWLCLDYQPVPCWNSRLRRIDALRSLKEMRVLETLIVDGRAIVGDGFDWMAADGTVLTYLLPASIKSLTIWHPYKGISQDLLQLAKESSTRFPNLQTVRLRCAGAATGEHLRMVAVWASFTAQGIKFRQSGGQY